MRPTFGDSWACVALLTLVACSSPAPPPAEGNAIISSPSNGCNFVTESIFGPGGVPSSAGLGGTVLDGTKDSNGDTVQVSCSVTSHGSLNASIESSAMSLVIYSGNVGGGADMSFYVASSGNPNAESIDEATRKPAANCPIDTSAPYILKAGSIYAHFDCPHVLVSSSTSLECDVNGFFVFTGCNK